MVIRIQCPAADCGAVCTANDTVAGRTVECPKCGRPFAAPATLDGPSRAARKSRPTATADPFPALPAEFGRYRVLRLLGRGGMGAVYLARDADLGRDVALKIPFIDGADARRAERFAREARSAAALHHPNVCTVFDAGRVGGRPFLTMAYVEGAPLDRAIDPDAPMPPRRAAEVARGIARALAYAHGRGVVHRDLKPANVMLTPAGDPVVMDFGLAKLAGEADAREVALTREGGLVGTPGYMAPEQVRGETAAVGPRTDVYALGAVLFEMLAGRPPYVGALATVLGQILGAPVPSVRLYRAAAPAWLDAVCRQALAKDPADRFASMAAFADALDLYLRGPADVLTASHVSAGPAAIVPSAPAPVPAAEPVPMAAPVAPPMPGPRVPTAAPFDALEDDSPPPAREPNAAARKPNAAARPNRLRIAAIVLAVLLPIAGLAAAVVLRLDTPTGTLIVELDGADVEARVRGGKVVLAGPDGKDRYTLAPADRSKEIEPGPYKVRVDGADGLALDTPEFTLKKGGKVTVRVTAAPKPPPKPDGSGAVAGPGRPGEVVTNSIGMKLAPIPAGKFLMGSPVGEEGRNDDEGPEHEVEITKGFYIGVYEVTQAEYAAVTGKFPSRIDDVDRGRFPVERVSYADATNFCTALSAMPQERARNRRYRLPTEAEWEYACRGGAASRTSFSFGDTLGTVLANFRGSQLGRPKEVGSYQPNGYGLYDMHGNVGEWCADWYGKDYYRTSPANDPPGPASGTYRVLRGGAWAHPARNARSAFRTDLCLPTVRYDTLGFRVVMRTLSAAGAELASRAPDAPKSQENRPSDPPRVPPDAGFVPLFNGKDLTGWAVDGATRATWTAADGVIVARSPYFRDRNYLLSDRDYSDYALRFDFLATGERGTDGAYSHGAVAVRAVPGEKLPLADGRFVFDHPMIKLTHPAREEAEGNGKSHWLRSAAAGIQPSRRPTVTPDTWHAVEVVVRGDRCTASFDGREAVDVSLDRQAAGPEGVTPGLKRAAGRVGFQINTGVVKYRNVRVKDLAAAAAADGGDFAPLFNGMDLTGWAVEHGDAGRWAVSGGELVGAPPAADPSNYVLSDRSFADFELRLEFNLGPGSVAAVAFRAARGEKMPTERAPAVYDHPVVQILDTSNKQDPPFGSAYWIDSDRNKARRTDASRKIRVGPGEWHRLEVAVRGPECTVRVDGEQIHGLKYRPSPNPDGTYLPALARKEGKVGLKAHFGTVRFRNVELKELLSP